MNIVLIIVLALTTIIIVCLAWIFINYNRLIRLKALLDEGWSGIEVQLKRRYDLIPNLVSIVKGYSIHEKNILEDITRLRSASMGATSPEQKVAAETNLSRTLKNLFAVAENYPTLKANENFLALQKDLGTIEQDIQLARRYYNATARNYNITTTAFPSNVLASFFGFIKAPYFEIQTTERNAPTVQF